MRRESFPGRGRRSFLAILLAGWLLPAGSLLGQVAPVPDGLLLTVPESVTVQAGSVSIPVRLNEGSGIAAVQFTLLYDSSVLRLLSVGRGGLLVDHGLTLNPSNTDEIVTAVVSLSLTSMREGKGAVAVFRFDTIDPGETAYFDLADISASDSRGAPLEIDYDFAIPPPEPLDIPTLQPAGLLLLGLVLALSGLILTGRRRGNF